jgi:glycosyltransferase involved in cell wall biosynthesis
MERLFHTVLDRTRPDVVHLQHLHLHSIGYIDIASRRRLPLLYTLHEYILMCLNEGRLLRPGPMLCEAPETSACAQCAPIAYPYVAIEQQKTRSYGKDWIRKVGRAVGIGSTRTFGQSHAAYEEEVQRRRHEIQTQLDKVNLFIAPSGFLRKRFIEEGMVPPDRIVHSDYGFFVPPIKRNSRRQPSHLLRAGYIGTISEHKGVHLIVEAFREIREPGIECRIYGDLDVFPDFKERLFKIGIPPGLQYMGRLENGHVADALGDLDLLIVPSIWYENSPLTIHEAFLAGLPVLTSDCGGMAELVEHNKTGLHFRTGDAADLRRQLLRVLYEPDLLASLSQNLPTVKSIDEDAAHMENLYGLLLNKLPVN